MEKSDLARGRMEDMKIFTEDEYKQLMSFFATLIHQIGTDAAVGKVRQQVVATACVYFKRFYVRRSFKDIDPFLLAPTCLFLASKVEEHGMLSTNKLMSAIQNICKKMRVTAEVTCRVGFIHEAEFILLEILDCCLIVYQPYRTIKQLFQDLRENGLNDKDKGSSKGSSLSSTSGNGSSSNQPPLSLDELEAATFRACNDSLKTDLSLLYPPHIIAIGCLQFAVIQANRENDFLNWFADLSIDYDKVMDVVDTIVAALKLAKDSQDRGKEGENEVIKALLDRMPKVMATPPHNPMPPPRMPNQQTSRY